MHAAHHESLAVLQSEPALAVNCARVGASSGAAATVGRAVRAAHPELPAASRSATGSAPRRRHHFRKFPAVRRANQGNRRQPSMSILCSPGSVASSVPRQRPGSLFPAERWCACRSVPITFASPISSFMLRRSMVMRSGRRRHEVFLLEIRLLHQPVGEAPQQVGMRPAAFIAARPEPDMVGHEASPPVPRRAATGPAAALRPDRPSARCRRAATVSTRRNQRPQFGCSSALGIAARQAGGDGMLLAESR